MLRFLADHPEIPLRGGSVTKQAAHLVDELLKRDANTVFPESIADLMLATQLKSQLDVPEKYTFEQIRLLTPAELVKFGEILGISENLSRGRVYSLLYFLDAIVPFSVEEILISDPVLQNICSNLTFNEAVNLQITKKLKNIPCELPVTDVSNLVTSLPGINADTKLLNHLISKYGSYSVIADIFSASGYEDNEEVAELLHDMSKEDRYRLAEILISRISNELMFTDMAVEQSVSAEILKMFIRHGLNLRKNQEGSEILFENALSSPDSLEMIKLLLAAGANPNFMVSTGMHVAGNELPAETPPSISFLKLVEGLDQHLSEKDKKDYPNLPQIIEVLKSAGAQ